MDINKQLDKILYKSKNHKKHEEKESASEEFNEHFGLRGRK